MNWKEITNTNIVNEIQVKSQDIPVVIFKNSTRCGISGRTLQRFENDLDQENSILAEFYLLDIINHRDVSNNIAETFGVAHQSPQLLIIKDERCIFHTSHMDISFAETKKIIAETPEGKQ